MTEKLNERNCEMNWQEYWTKRTVRRIDRNIERKELWGELTGILNEKKEEMLHVQWQVYNYLWNVAQIHLTEEKTENYVCKTNDVVSKEGSKVKSTTENVMKFSCKRRLSTKSWRYASLSQVFTSVTNLLKNIMSVQTKLRTKTELCLFSVSLPPANEVWGKVIFLHQFVILFMGGHAWLLWGACMVLFGGHAWFYLEGHVRCVVLFRGHAWFYSGGMCGFIQGACMVLFRGACMVLFGGRAWFFQFFRIQWDTVNERAVRILLECILVLFLSSLLNTQYDFKA